MLIPELRLWTDDAERDGPENMAIDEWLMTTSSVAVLRVYRWRENWGSFGYFVPLSETRREMPGLELVRRWTGGGMVDHRSDWTYTLVVPSGQELTRAKGGASYRFIHAALAGALGSDGHEVRLASELPPSRGGVCFSSPVDHDLIDACGRKIAGAGQRRGRAGLLHQGSVSFRPGEGVDMALAEGLSKRVFAEAPEIDPVAARALADRYVSEAWTGRR